MKKYILYNLLAFTFSHYIAGIHVNCYVPESFNLYYSLWNRDFKPHIEDNIRAQRGKLIYPRTQLGSGRNKI